MMTVFCLLGFLYPGELDKNGSNELLHLVIEMWLTIRGYSIAGACMDGAL